jgi:hypothetical protein
MSLDSRLKRLEVIDAAFIEPESAFAEFYLPPAVRTMLGNLFDALEAHGERFAGRPDATDTFLAFHEMADGGLPAPHEAAYAFCVVAYRTWLDEGVAALRDYATECIADARGELAAVGLDHAFRDMPPVPDVEQPHRERLETDARMQAYLRSVEGARRKREALRS